MQTILLSSLKRMLVDDEDASLASQYSWQVDKRGYAYRHILVENGVQRTVYFHREVVGAEDVRCDVDHINHDGLDNRKDNLRIATHAENMQNRMGANSNSSTGYRGVSKNGNNWGAHLTLNYKKIWLGTFPTIEEAAQAAADGRKRLMTHSMECEGK